MRWLISIFLAVLLWVTACQKITDPVGNQAGAFSFSFSKGTTWTFTCYDTTIFQTSGFVSKNKVTIPVTVLEDTVLQDGKKVQTLYTEFGDLGDFEYLRFAHDSLCFYENLQGDLSNLFLFPLYVGRSWEVKQDSMVVLGPEKIKTQCGEFNTYRIKRYVFGADRTGEIDYWIADKFGIVRKFENLFFKLNNSIHHVTWDLSNTNLK